LRSGSPNPRSRSDERVDSQRCYRHPDVLANHQKPIRPGGVGSNGARAIDQKRALQPQRSRPLLPAKQVRFHVDARAIVYEEEKHVPCSEHPSWTRFSPGSSTQRSAIGFAARIASARSPRSSRFTTLPRDRPGLEAGLGARCPVLCVRAGHPQDDLHQQCGRGAASQVSLRECTGALASAGDPPALPGWQ
jgi:hypothetical protein